MADVTDKDREALERALTWTNTTIADTVVKTEVALRAIAQARAEERADILALCSHYATAAGCREAIRARGEKGED